MRYIIITIFFLFSSSSFADSNTTKNSFIVDFNSQTDALYRHTLLTTDPAYGLVADHLITDAFIFYWGKKYWKWGTKSFHFNSEPWFEKDSQTGGSDKTGHFYMTYLLSRVLSSRMEDRGWNVYEASLAGTLSGLLAMTLLEVGDGTSEYGFSKEDLIADTLGATLSYILRTNPRLDDFIDIRLEYLPTKDYLSNGDNTTDYSGMRHLAAFKLSGFESLKKSYWSLLEFQVGYYSRGYRTYDTVPKSQHLYVGVGLSLADLARRSQINVLKNIFEFYQPGHTYVDTDLWSR